MGLGFWLVGRTAALHSYDIIGSAVDSARFLLLFPHALQNTLADVPYVISYKMG